METEICQDVDVKIFVSVNVADLSDENTKSNIDQNDLERGDRTHDER